LSNYVVNSHEVGVLRELGDDFSCTHTLSLTCYRGDRHEALLWGSVHSVFDLVESLCELPDGQRLMETPAPFIPPFVAFTSGILVGVGLVYGCVGRQLVC
jgi:hypothetical protein